MFTCLKITTKKSVFGAETTIDFLSFLRTNTNIVVVNMRSNLLIVLCVIISLQSGYSKVFDNPPPFPEKAKMARYVVHNSGK